MNMDSKEVKRKIQARNKVLAFRLLNTLWPGYKNMPSLKSYVNQLALNLNFSEEWFVKKIDLRVGKHVRNGGIYQPEHQQQGIIRKESRAKRLKATDLDSILLREKEKERRNNIDKGIPYPNMTPEEQNRLKLALQKKSSESETRQKRLQYDGLSEREKRLIGNISHLTNTKTRLWLASLPETDRIDFASWCARKGMPPVQNNWEAFTQSSTVSQAESSMQDYASVKNKLLKAGWTENEFAAVGNDRLNMEYRAENARQKLDTPHFNKRKAATGQAYTLVKIRTAQGLFRADVLRNWGEKCAITGTRLALEAAHILSHAKGGAPSVENGICLAADLHTLLDYGHLRIVNGRVKLSDEARVDERYACLEGRPLRKPLVEVHFPSEEE